MAHEWPIEAGQLFKLHPTLAKLEEEFEQVQVRHFWYSKANLLKLKMARCRLMGTVAVSLVKEPYLGSGRICVTTMRIDRKNTGWTISCTIPVSIIFKPFYFVLLCHFFRSLAPSEQIWRNDLRNFS